MQIPYLDLSFYKITNLNIAHNIHKNPAKEYNTTFIYLIYNHRTPLLLINDSIYVYIQYKRIRIISSLNLFFCGLIFPHLLISYL